MGRWAQRRRAGGGPNLATSVPASMILVENLEGSDQDFGVTYDQPILASNFTPDGFIVHPAIIEAQTVTQATPTQITVSLAAPVPGQTDMEYSGSNPRVVHPQTIPIS